ncbi:uncharacterized protein N7459_006532 [Penicillium hispanicum]|uniref:uncharacterized protein n=1 Tax=Penicillium hispanicum TaxID=1080232 RepID=UPI00253FD2B2|nr:uncharacterized protein N7459_006532 [Penicillium hispanicum]KAJ5577568.1 hypothetical protein N7459_006532 [Penicillium hispanicum]
MFIPNGCDPMDFENEVTLWSVTGLQGEGGNIEDNIQAYFDYLGLTWNTQQTVRISPVSGQANIIQYMLPPGLLKANRAHQAYPLDLEVICSSDEAKMKSDWEGKVLNIDDWKNVNTEGDIHRGSF